MLQCVAPHDKNTLPFVDAGMIATNVWWSAVLNYVLRKVKMIALLNANKMHTRLALTAWDTIEFHVINLSSKTPFPVT